MRQTTIAGALLCAVALAGCGGNGGGGAKDGSQDVTQALVTLSTQGSTGSQTIYGVQATLHLPTGVTADADASGKTADGVVASSGVAANASAVAGHYSAAGGTVKVMVVKGSGFGVGEFATLKCSVAKGSSPKAADFSLVDAEFKAVDSNGVAISGVSAAVTVDIK